MRPHGLAAILMLPLLCGCESWPLSSKWAMDDPDYAAKYSEPYGDDKPVRMLKQMVDARHLEKKGGGWIGAAAAGDPLTAGAEGGLFYHPTAWSEINVSLLGLAGTGDQDWYIGPQAGLRLQSPSRIAPFVGVGAFAGFNRHMVAADNDRRDNDDDGFIDEFGEEDRDYNAFLGVYPEVGVHLWTSGRHRITANARYCITEDGRDSDFLFLGLAFGFCAYAEEDTPPDTGPWATDANYTGDEESPDVRPQRLTTKPFVDEDGWIDTRRNRNVSWWRPEPEESQDEAVNAVDRVSGAIDAVESE